MNRSLWKYRPLLCKLGLHATSERRASTWVKVGNVHRPGYRVVAECDRPMCTYSTEVAAAVVVPSDQARIVPDRIAP